MADKRYNSRTNQNVFFMFYCIYFAYQFLRDFLTHFWLSYIKTSFIILFSYITTNFSIKFTSDVYNDYIITGNSHMTTSTSKKELRWAKLMKMACLFYNFLVNKQ